MRVLRSIRHKAVLFFTTFTLLMALAYSGLTVVVAYVVEDVMIDKLLAQEVEYLHRHYASEGNYVEPRLDYMTLYLDNTNLPSPIADTLSKYPSATEIFTNDETHYHIVYLTAVDSGSRAILVVDVKNLLTVTNMAQSILWVMGTLMCLGLLFAIWFAYRIANAATQPIVQLSHEVQQFAQNRSLSANIKDDQTEVGFLASTIEANFTQLHAALQREVDFTRDVSHELRTPLTIIKNTLGLIEHRHWQPQDKTLLDKASNQMQDTINVLLALARKESLDTQQINLRPMLEECVLRTDAAFNQTDFSVELDMPDDCSVVCSKELLVLLVNNLIDNARQHASGNILVVRAEADKIVFSNTNNQQFIHDLTDAQIKSESSQGSGLGLYLVKRIAAALGWTLRLDIHASQFSVILCYPNRKIAEISPQIDP